MPGSRRIRTCAALVAFASFATLGAFAAPDRLALEYEGRVAPLLSRYCLACHGHGKHKGDLALDKWTNQVETIADQTTWTRVLQKLQTREMPPENKPQPSEKQRQWVADWIQKAVLHCDCDHPDPGRVTLRRLNRAEYNNTIRDLFGVDFKPAADFPVDDSGYGFDNIGDALALPSVLLEKYLASAQQVLEVALGPLGEAASQTKRFPVDALEVGYNAKQRGDGWVALNSIEEDDLALKFAATSPGEYRLRVHAYARQETTNAIKLTFMRDKQAIRVVEVETNASLPRVYEAQLHLSPGNHRLRAVVRRIKDSLSEADALQWKSGPPQKGAVVVQWLEVEGPLNATRTQDVEARRRLFTQSMPGQEAEAARATLGKFTPKAWRRPLKANELTRLVELAETARNRCVAADAPRRFEEGIRVALQAVLVSPNFLFRGELQPEPDNPKSIHRVNEFVLASRLSYFLWSTMPDDDLFALAQQGKLTRNLEKQVRRMLANPKAHALVENFSGQWLQTRNLELAAPDRQLFPRFDPALPAAMKIETELFFQAILREDRSILDFLAADWTFVNERLARHYGISWNPTNSLGAPPNQSAKTREAVSFRPAHLTPSLPSPPAGKRKDAFALDPSWQRVSLRGTPRRGVLTQGAILTLTSNPTRTSPVKRGKWVLDNLLNAPPPPPPPNVPELKDAKELKGTLRQRMEQHRADALCASCHQRMDPIGFGLENFDAIGAWREQDGGSPIDATGELRPNQTFNGSEELIAILANQKRDQFVRCLVEKLLTYALGRGMESYDQCAVDEICRRLPKHDYKFSELVLEITKSVPFQMRRGDGSVP